MVYILYIFGIYIIYMLYIWYIKPLQSRIPSLLLLPSFPPPSCQSNFLIINISAKSSQIITKFSGELSVSVPWWLKQKTNKYINNQPTKQTNKQTNKHFQSNFLILNISAKSSRIFWKFLGKLSVGILQWLKQKTNGYINKQTNKQTNKHFPV